MGKLWRRLNYLLRRDRMEAELAEEMEFHRSLAERALDGNSAAASRAMGNQTLAREDARGVCCTDFAICAASPASRSSR